MNRLKFHILSSLVILALLVAVPAGAGGSGAFIAVYNSGRALVKETRVVTLPKGLASVVIKDMPSTLDSTSVHVSARDLTIYDLQYSFTPIDTKSLLDKYVGKQLSVILPDPADANARILRKATLVSNSNEPIFLVGNEVYVGDYEALLLPKMPTGLDPEPMLTLTTKSGTEGKKDVTLSYLMDGLTWRADYALSVDKTGKQAAIDAWATLTNSSGTPFQGADIRLVAGDVQRAQAPRRNYRGKAMVAMEAAPMDAGGVPQPVEESFSQYHVYNLARPVSLPPSGTKQVSLFSASKITVEQDLVSRFRMGANQHSGVIKQAVESNLTIQNTAKNNLGRPIPAGLVRVFMPDSGGNQLLAGEISISHIARDGKVKLTLGRSFDVTVERTQTAFKRLGKNSYEMSWQMVVKNAKDTPQKIRLRDAIPGQWKVLKAEPKYNRIDSGTIEFNLGQIPPSGNGPGTTINYTVQITY